MPRLTFDNPHRPSGMRNPDHYRLCLTAVEALLLDAGLSAASRRSAERLVVVYRAMIPEAEAEFGLLVPVSPPKLRTCELPGCQVQFAGGHGKKTCSPAHQKALARQRQRAAQSPSIRRRGATVRMSRRPDIPSQVSDPENRRTVAESAVA